MKRVVATVLMVAGLLPVSALAQGATSNAELEAKIRALDMAHAEAIFKGDAVALDLLMDDNVVVNHPTNRIVNEKQELLALINQGVIRYTSFERRPEKFIFYPNMVVVMGGETVVPARGAPNEGQVLQRRYTNVWMNQGGTWRLAFRHANNVCAAADAPQPRD